jgi:hypothetical protein
MNKVIMIAVALLVALCTGESPRKQEPPAMVNRTGFVTVGWVFAKPEEDLYDMWAAHSDNIKLKGSVADFLDWAHVSKIIVIYNAWHLLGNQKDIRIQHIEDNLGKASFGDRFKGTNPGGTYMLLLRYRDSDRMVLLSFTQGVFLIESERRIGVVDIRKDH